MTTHRVTATRRISAPAPVTYAIIADYRDGHPHIIPPRWFRNLRVESGGVGAGTVIDFDMIVLGSVKKARGRVEEPTPGRVLTETYTDGIVTSFIVDRVNGTSACDVTIASDLPVHTGLQGALERSFFNWFLRRVFFAELDLLNTVAQTRATAKTNGERRTQPRTTAG